jgi:RNA polymerase sigma factor (sigma-70 family)
MNVTDDLTKPFEASRPHLEAVAYRMLGSKAEAEDAVQEAWIRLQRSEIDQVSNLRGWLTTVVARVCLDMLRSRKSRREDDASNAEPVAPTDPGTEIELANSVGLALLVILEMLDPAERLAFVLHDLFAMPFDDIAPVVGKTVEATRQLASRARRRVQGAGPAAAPDLDRQRVVIDAWLAAVRGGDFDALIALLHPDATLHVDAPFAPHHQPLDLRGAEAIAKRAQRGGARAAQPVVVDGTVGVIIAPRGKLMMVLRFTFEGEKIVAIDGVADADRLAALSLAVI